MLDMIQIFVEVLDKVLGSLFLRTTAVDSLDTDSVLLRCANSILCSRGTRHCRHVTFSTVCVCGDSHARPTDQILDEIVVGGLVLETNTHEILIALKEQKALENKP